jgi:hypothetical protein
MFRLALLSLTLSLLLAAVGLPACKRAGSDQLPLVTSASEWETRLRARNEGHPLSTPFLIGTLRRQDATLLIDVKGCAGNSYTVVWDGRLLESYPVRIQLLVYSLRHDRPCTDSAKTYTLSVDLRTLLGMAYGDGPVMVTVINASQKWDKQIDADDRVTDKKG